MSSNVMTRWWEEPTAYKVPKFFETLLRPQNEIIAIIGLFMS